MGYPFLKFKYLSSSPSFWVTLSLLTVLIPHFERLPLWMTGIIVGAFIWRLLAIKDNHYLPKKWLVFIITLSTCVATFLHYGTLLGKTAGTAFLSILLAIKLLESHSKRDYMLILGMSFFVIATNFLFSQSIPTLFHMLLTIVVLILSMISINLNDLDIDLKEKLRITGRLISKALPLALILFFLFPRIPGPLWKLPDDSLSAQTGLPQSMSPGNISQLIQSSSVAFRVKFKDTVPAQNKLYWRALVFWDFDGKTWQHGASNRTPSPTLEIIDQFVEYTVTLEPHDKHYLFALDMPEQAPVDSYYNADFLLRSKNKIESLHQYSTGSFLNYRIQNNISSWEAHAGLKIHGHQNQRTIALGKKWKKTLKEPSLIADRALKHFNQNLFSYTLSPPLTPGLDPVDQFLFDTRKGFCEHYASSFTLLMRAAGVPARVVIGYQGGEINPVNQYLTVRQSDAHAWSEIWLKHKGWVRIDPTSAIAPERIEINLNSALGSNESRPFYMRLSNGPLKKLIVYWDAIDNSWKQWVIGYDSKLQKQILSSLFNKNLSLYDISIILLIAFFIAAGMITFFILKSTSRIVIDPTQKVYDDFCAKLSKKGLTRNIYEGPMDFSSRAVEKFPQQKSSIELITKIYINLRFKSKHRDKLLEQMKQTLRALKLK